MPSLFYFGAPANEGQEVSHSVLSRGLNYLRVAPSDVLPIVTRSFTTPQYMLYCQAFANFAKAAFTKKPVELGEKTLYYANPIKTFPKIFTSMTISWRYPEQKKDEEIEKLKGQFGAEVGMAKQKPCLVADLTPKQLSSLLETNPERTTPCSTTSLNVAGYLCYIKLLRLVEAYIVFNQYSLVKHDEESSSLMRDFVYIGDWKKGMGDDVSSFWLVNTHKSFKFHANLPEGDFKKVQRYITNSDEIPNEGGILLPFISDLAREDDGIVPRVVERYFMELLGNTEQQALRECEDIRSNWGNIKSTPWGSEMAHIFACIEVSFQAGTYLKLMVSPSSGYNGCALMGGHFTLTRGEEEWTPCEFSKLQKLFSHASPHAAALERIVQNLRLPEEENARTSAMKDIVSMSRLARAIRTFGYDTLAYDEIRSDAKYLDFLADRYLPLTSVNISRVLNAIANKEEDELQFPLHRLALMEKDRTKRLLSAFGAYSFSFQVANGRKMSLDNDKFTWTVLTKGFKKEKVTRETTRMFIEVVTWERACEAFETTLTTRSVLSPIGTELASRASTRSMVREFSGDNGKQVLEGLKKIIGKSKQAVDVSGAGKKRARDGDDEDTAAKRAKKDEELNAFEIEDDEDMA